MEEKLFEAVPIPPCKFQRVEIYIKELQERLHQLRTNHDLIFLECSQILNQIQEVSTQTMTKHQEIGAIIEEFKQIELKTDRLFNSNISNPSAEKIDGDVKKLAEKFESICQNNLSGVVEKESKKDINQRIQTKIELENTDEVNHEECEEIHQNIISRRESFYSLENISSGSVETLYFDQIELRNNLD